MAHLVLFAQHLESRFALFHHQGRDRLATFSQFAPLAEQKHEVSDVAVRDERLGTIDYDFIGVRIKPRTHTRGIGSCCRLGDGKSANATVENSGQQLIFLLVRSERNQRLNGVERGRPDQASRCTRFTDLPHTIQVRRV